MYLSEQFNQFVEWCADRSPLYAHLSTVVARNQELLKLAGTVPEGRSVPLVFLAGVHSLVLQQPDHQLGAYYPTCVSDPRAPDEELGEAFRQFCRANEARLTDILCHRRTQTNEIGRCAALYPALARVGERVDGPLAVVDVGASAGLNLLFDRYTYRYGDGTYGAEDSPVTMRTQFTDSTTPRLPASGPDIGSRIGVDVCPLSVTDESDVRWLRALVWPEHTARHDRLQAAIELARESQPELVAGDAIESLPTIVDKVPESQSVCVMNTQTLYQFSDDDRGRFRETLSSISEERPIYWLSGEVISITREAPELTCARVDGGPIEPETLAEYDSHGRWIRWVAD